MQLLSHRGFWKDPVEQNSFVSFKRALEAGFGLEVDIRDFHGELYVAHDVPSGKELPLIDLLELWKGAKQPIAFNIKADGLSNQLKKRIDEFEISNYFTFDMSFPELIRYSKLRLKPFVGVNEFASNLGLKINHDGVWLDSFETDWYGWEVLDTCLASAERLAIVSPELHGRDHFPLWRMLKSNFHKISDRLMLCTDFPDQAYRFFMEDQ